MALAAAVGVANEGAKLFAAGDFAAAAQRFTAALDGLPAYDAAESDCRDADTAQVALSRARALNNRASCSLRTGVPLAALDDVADALATLCDPARMVRGVPAPRPGCAGFALEALGVMLTTMLKLAAAYDAAGSPVAAQPGGPGRPRPAPPRQRRAPGTAARYCRGTAAAVSEAYM